MFADVADVVVDDGDESFKSAEPKSLNKGKINHTKIKNTYTHIEP